MSRVAYVGGRYVAHRDARVHVEDRGYQFADGVYEVILVAGGRMVDADAHLDRLHRSLRALEIPPPRSRAAMMQIFAEIILRNGFTDGIVYLQVTRGAAPRAHAFPKRTSPMITVTARPLRPRDPRLAESGVSVLTRPDLRWRRADIKSISLLPNVLAKEEAMRAGGFEAWLVNEKGEVTEGATTNAWIVGQNGTTRTHPADQCILDGVTRRAVRKIIRRRGLKFEERPFSVTDAYAASEAFLTSTTSHVLPVTRLDGRSIGDGTPGPVTRDLMRLYQRHIAAQARGHG